MNRCLFLKHLVAVALIIMTLPQARAETTRGIFVSPTTGVSVGTVWGVFVGVSQYQDKSLNLTYADRDAHSLYVFFSDHFTGRISPDHFRLLTNDQATRGRVLQVLNETFRLAQPEDLVIISLAMHGLPDPAGNDLYFLAYDTDPNYPEDRAISQYDLIKQIQRSKARKIVLVLDACHAGKFGASSSNLRGASSAEVNRMLTTLGQVQDGIVVLTSSSAAEASHEGAEFCGGHGVFTCALVEGLKGKADTDRNGLVQVRELYDYAYHEVKQQTKGLQHPAIEGRYDNGLPLATTLSAEDRKLLGITKNEMKFTDYEGLKTKAEYQSKLEKAWHTVDSIARMQELPEESRSSAITQFLQDFPEANRHRIDADKLADQIKLDTKQRELEEQKQIEARRARDAIQAKLEQAWTSVQRRSQLGDTDPKNRLLALNRFLQDFPEDNRYRSKAETLAEQLRRDAKKGELEQQKRLELSQASAAYQSKLEQSWTSVQGAVQQAPGDPKNRLSALNRFLQDFPEDNEHRVEAEKLIERIQREAKQNGPREPKQTEPREPKQTEIARAPIYNAPQAGREPDSKLPREITGRDGAPMVLIPSGEFVMGSSAASDERPAHRVYLDAYYLDAFEVTISRYAKFIESVTTQQAPHQWNTVNLTEDGDRPVIGVNWSDADAYCRWTEKRLPAEAEWEKAARGTDGRKYPWGDEDPGENVANFGRCCGWSGFELLAVVGTHPAGKSPYGAFDLTGNVWEWVADWYDPQYYKTSPDRNPRGPSSGRDKVIRGSSWSNRVSDLRASIRDRVSPTYRNFSIGFRCAASVRE
jgi:formylglycine-generating enzyme required for sulfatase activity